MKLANQVLPGKMAAKTGRDIYHLPGLHDKCLTCRSSRQAATRLTAGVLIVVTVRWLLTGTELCSVTKLTVGWAWFIPRARVTAATSEGRIIAVRTTTSFAVFRVMISVLTA